MLQIMHDLKAKPPLSPEEQELLQRVKTLRKTLRDLEQLLKPWDELTDEQRVAEVRRIEEKRRRKRKGKGKAVATHADSTPAAESADAAADPLAGALEVGPDASNRPDSFDGAVATAREMTVDEVKAQLADSKYMLDIKNAWPSRLSSLRKSETISRAQLKTTERAFQRSIEASRAAAREKAKEKTEASADKAAEPLHRLISEAVGTGREGMPAEASRSAEPRQPAEQDGQSTAGPAQRVEPPHVAFSRAKERDERAREERRPVGRIARARMARRSEDSDSYANHPALRREPHTFQSVPQRDLSSYQYKLSPSSTPFTPHPSPLGDVPVATLAHSLDRVLFNPGVHFLRDPRTGVYNFARDTLENVPKVAEFEFGKLPQYVTSSRDETLKGIAESEGRMFVGSTSSTIGMLCQIYFWLSKGKLLNTGMLSEDFRHLDRTFSMGQRLPASVVLRHDNGRYSVDADKSFDSAIEQNILAHYGHLMEKLLTTEATEFKRFLKGSDDPAPSEADHRQAYHYGLTDHMVLRSQLDAHNSHLPNKTFDLKTRGTVAIRQDRLNYEEGAGYRLDRLRGSWESFEREYYDLIRSAFLKYQFQARIGCMDGIFVAYHSTARFYGFQYIPINEMDEALFGNSDTGDQVFHLALGVLETLLQRAAACYPGESVNVTWAADVEEDVLRVFVARQSDVEAVEREETINAVEGAAKADESKKDRDDPPAIPMTLLEVRGTNYVDGVAQRDPVTIEEPAPVDPAEVDPDAPGEVSLDELPQQQSAVWQVGFDIVASSTKNLEEALPRGSPVVPPLQVAALFAATRRTQRMFSALYLPTGVSPADVAQAQKRAAKEGVELDPSDLAVRFPLEEGVEYIGPSKTVSRLRKMAREGQGRTRVVEELHRKEGEGGKEVVVEVRSEVIEREV
ncbi:Pet127p [Rhodotorula paludigena]|uniref:Pet127p n=1 Tax=Rhodotorula paludigena TaxID=86838 RepID=UPI0031701DF7